MKGVLGWGSGVVGGLRSGGLGIVRVRGSRGGRKGNIPLILVPK